VLFIRACAGQYLPKWRPGTDYRKNVSARKELGGGVILEMSHEIDYVRWFCGEVKEVQSLCGKVSGFEIDVEDTAEINLWFENGAIGNIHLDMVDQAKNRSCRIVGTEGTILWDLLDESKVNYYSNQAEEWVDLGPDKPYDHDEMFFNEIHHFFDCVKNNVRPLVTADDAKRVLEIALEAKKTIKNLEAVKI